MALTTRLEFRQSQALVMTPQLMQAIKLLQLSNLDLMAYVEEELEKNPLLERVTDDNGPNAAAEAAEQSREGSDLEGVQEWTGEDLATSRNAMEDDLGTRLDNVFPEDGGTAIASARTACVTTARKPDQSTFGSGARSNDVLPKSRMRNSFSSSLLSNLSSSRSKIR